MGTAEEVTFCLLAFIALYVHHIFTQVACALVNTKLVDVTQANTHYWICEYAAPMLL